MDKSLAAIIERARLSSLSRQDEPEHVDENLVEARALESAGIPKRYRSAEPQTKHAEALESGRNVYICGDVGTGKTLFACGIARAYLQRHGSGVDFVSSVNLLSQIRSTYGNAATESSVLTPYAKARVLVLDDLGKEVPSEWALERLFALIDERYSNLRPTVVTTNFSPSELIARLGSKGDEANAKAIVSRLVEGAVKLRLSGADRRLS